MKRGFIFLILFINSFFVFAQTEVGPEGPKLLWGLLLVILLFSVIFLIGRFLERKKEGAKKKSVFKRNSLSIQLEKDKVYFPDFLTLSVQNTGNRAVDLDQPLLIFSNLWIKRNFRLKGMHNRQIYPLYLEAGKTHKLEIDLNRFYRHDKSLKKYPKSKIVIYDVKGKKFGSRSIFLRKTLFKW